MAIIIAAMKRMLSAGQMPLSLLLEGELHAEDF